MVGEFRHTNGDAYVMIVNLSLERSAKFTLTTRQPGDSIRIVSAVDGSLSAFDTKNGLWIVAGQGALLALGR
jgi:frataxin-like iron-binding protein CyaY